MRIVCLDRLQPNSPSVCGPRIDTNLYAHPLTILFSSRADKDAWHQGAATHHTNQIKSQDDAVPRQDHRHQGVRRRVIDRHPLAAVQAREGIAIICGIKGLKAIVVQHRQRLTDLHQALQHRRCFGLQYRQQVTNLILKYGCGLW